ncbi:MAG: C4-type zinc ribbon domain-containing protein [Thermodesulfobacteriota bacterium]
MNEKLRNLILLQNNEIEFEQTRLLIEKMEQQRIEIDKRLKDFEVELNNDIQAVAELRKEYRSMESDVQTNNERIKKSENTLRAVKTNREYQAILKEIEDQKAKIAILEDAMLERLEKIDEAERAVGKKKEEQKLILRETEKEKGLIDQEKKQGEESLSRLSAVQQQILQTVDATLHKKYLVIKNRMGTTVVVPVKNYVCFGCNLNIPPQMYNELQQKDDLAFCPHCQRMIYWEVGQTV